MSAAMTASGIVWMSVSFAASVGDRQREVARVAEVPRQAVEVAADVAARARLIAERRGERRVVEVLPARGDARRLGVEHRRRARPRASVPRSTTEMPSSKRVSTKATPRRSSTTTPVGPPPERITWLAGARRRRCPPRAPRCRRWRACSSPARRRRAVLPSARDGEVLRERAAERRVAGARPRDRGAG